MADYTHKPVMEAAAVQSLLPRDKGHYVDGTLGGSGHAQRILQESSPTGVLSGFDLDGDAINTARERLARFAGRFELFQAGFDTMAERLPAASCDGVLLDLGVSSHQLDTPERGFSFQHDAPLDMRLGGQGMTAADWINDASEAELARVFFELGDEPNSRRIARAIAREREQQRISTTGQLAGLVERICPRHGRRTHPATKVFQAVRMHVNDELGALGRGLQAALQVLKPGGRLAVISFHSGEARMVKAFGRVNERDYEVTGEVDDPALRRPRAPLLRWVTRKAEKPSAEELAENPRARSAELRVYERL